MTQAWISQVLVWILADPAAPPGSEALASSASEPTEERELQSGTVAVVLGPT